MTEFHSTKVPGWVFAAAAGGVLFLLLVLVAPVVLLTVLSSNVGTQRPLTAQVIYDVRGTPQTADVYVVKSGRGGDNPRTPLPLDSRQFTFVATQGEDLFVDATYREGPGTLTCTIFVNGQSAVTRSVTVGFADFQKGALVHVTCEATAP